MKQPRRHSKALVETYNHYLSKRQSGNIKQWYRAPIDYLAFNCAWARKTLLKIKFKEQAKVNS